MTWTATGAEITQDVLAENGELCVDRVRVHITDEAFNIQVDGLAINKRAQIVLNQELAIDIKKQSENLWGRAVGQLNQVETDFICRVNKDEDGKIVLSVEQKETNKINTIPAHAKVHLIVRNRLRRQRFSCGTRGELTTPKDELTETAIMDAFTTDEHIYGALDGSLNMLNLGEVKHGPDKNRTPNTIENDYG